MSRDRQAKVEVDHRVKRDDVYGEGDKKAAETGEIRRLLDARGAMLTEATSIVRRLEDDLCAVLTPDNRAPVEECKSTAQTALGAVIEEGNVELHALIMNLDSLCRRLSI